MAITTYSPAQISVAINGVPVTGAGESDFVTWSRKEDSFTSVVGAQGEVTRVAGNDKSSSIELTLLQTSASNDFLYSLHKADELTNKGFFTFALTDNLGSTRIISACAYIMKVTDVSYSDGISERTWTIELPELTLDSHIGGNL